MGDAIAAQEILWVTAAGAPDWPAKAGRYRCRRVHQSDRHTAIPHHTLMSMPPAILQPWSITRGPNLACSPYARANRWRVICAVRCSAATQGVSAAVEISQPYFNRRQICHRFARRLVGEGAGRSGAGKTGSTGGSWTSSTICPTWTKKKTPSCRAGWQAPMSSREISRHCHALRWMRRKVGATVARAEFAWDARAARRRTDRSA